MINLQWGFLKDWTFTFYLSLFSYRFITFLKIAITKFIQHLSLFRKLLYFFFMISKLLVDCLLLSGGVFNFLRVDDALVSTMGLCHAWFRPFLLLITNIFNFCFYWGFFLFELNALFFFFLLRFVTNGDLGFVIISELFLLQNFKFLNLGLQYLFFYF